MGETCIVKANIFAVNGPVLLIYRCLNVLLGKT